MSQTENDLYKQALAVYLNSEKDTRPYWETDHRGMVMPLVKSGYNNSVSYGVPGILGGSAWGTLNDIIEGRQVAKGEIEQAAGDAAGAAMTGSFALSRPTGSIGSGGRTETPGIRAYHGSPHDFDKFDMSKIGSGEGAQAFGHGLYFAENEGVAKSYRDALAQSKNNTNYRIDGQQVAATDLASYEAAKLAHNAGGVDAALQTLMQNKASYPKVYFDKMSAALSDLKSRGAVVDKPETTGKMYEVNIKADPEHFLDWDKPLSQQSEKVRGALAPQIAEQMARREAFIKQYGESSITGEARGQNLAPRNQEELDAIRNAGIPGIKYLDQGSRGAGEGSRNYVVFDDSLVEILRKYGLAGLSILGGASVINNDPQSRQ